MLLPPQCAEDGLSDEVGLRGAGCIAAGDGAVGGREYVGGIAVYVQVVLYGLLLAAGQAEVHAVGAVEAVVYGGLPPKFFGGVVGEVYVGYGQVCQRFVECGKMFHFLTAGAAPRTPHVDIDHTPPIGLHQFAEDFLPVREAVKGCLGYGRDFLFRGG